MPTRILDGSKKIFRRGPPGSNDGGSPVRSASIASVSSNSTRSDSST
jgi:hypothetical protein